MFYEVVLNIFSLICGVMKGCEYVDKKISLLNYKVLKMNFDDLKVGIVKYILGKYLQNME